MIELKGISRVYRTGTIEVHALSDVDLRIERGEFVAIIGPSGSGKSTLLHILGFLDRATSGTYTFLERDITDLTDNDLAVLRNDLAGFVFQQFHLLPRITAVENAMLPLIYAGKSHLKKAATSRIDEVGLSHRAGHRPNELSGGEQQRVAIARALVNEPVLILADEPTGNLDSRSEKEIISVLENLNRQGKTIIMVTHEREIAEHAGRVIQMCDGKIISDDRTTRKEQQSVHSGAGADNNVRKVLDRGHHRGAKAEWKDHLHQAFHSVFSHKMRSFLSMLGILIGVGAVIAMMAVAQGAQKAINQRLSGLGSNLLMVWPGARHVHGVAMQTGAGTRFTLDDATAMSKLPSVKRMSPSIRGRGQLVYENRNWNSSVQGVNTDYAEMRATVPTVGRFITEQELRAREKVAVLGTTVVDELFEDANPVGRTIKINRVNFKVIGVMPSKGGSHWRDWDDVVIIPVTTAMYRLFGKRYVDYVDVEVRDADLIETAKEEINNLIIKRHRVIDTSEKSINIRDMTEIREALTSTTRTMGWLLGSIAAISLLVGGIGIMNIMLVSVTERTREIGLRKAIGARGSDIMTQFLIEAIVMTLSGGVIGIMLGAGVATLLSKLAGWPVAISPFGVTLAVTFSIAIGMIFGLWPARQAARLDPITALKYE